MRSVNANATSRMLSILLVTVAVAGCYRPARGVAGLAPGDRITRSGDAGNAPYIGVDVPVQVRQVLSEDIGRGVQTEPVVYGNVVVAVVTGGGIVAVSAEDGDRFWARRFRGAIAGQALRVGDRLLFATQHRDGEVHALDIRRGRRLWRRRLDARPAAEPAWADSVLYVAAERGRVVALDARTGAEQWRAEVGGVVRQPPAVVGATLLVASRDTLYALDRRTGARLSHHAVAGVPSAPLAISGDTVVIATQDGLVAAYAGTGAVELWRQATGDAILAAPVLTATGVYVMTRSAAVWHVGADGARELMRLDGAATESFTVARNGFLIGMLDGTLHFLDSGGAPVWAEDLGASIRAPAVLHDGAVFVTTLTGTLVKLRP